MSGHFGYLQDIIVLLFAAVFVVTFFKKIGLSPVLGYLSAGVAIGQYGFGIVSPDSSVSAFAEFGVVFLLFVIGLEMTFDRLVSMRLHVFGFGLAQTLITALFVSTFCHLILKIDIESSVIIGGSLSLSSTAIVLQVLKDSGQQSTQVGRLSLAVLLMQDFLVVPLLVLVPLLSASESSEVFSQLGLALSKAAVAMVVIFIAGRLLLRPALSIVSSFKSEELFIAAILLILLGTAYITQIMELSMAMGAFMAGLMIAETEFRHEVEHAILPFKGILLGLFFMIVGMNINTYVLANNIMLIASVVLGIIIFKSSLIIVLCRAFKFNWGSSIHSGLMLSQGGEFAFILFDIASEQRIMSDTVSQILMVSVTITMAVTPLLAMLGNKISKSLIASYSLKEQSDLCKDLDNHVIVAGMGRAGKVVISMLEEFRIDYVIVDVGLTEQDIRNSDRPLYGGDVTSLDFLNSIQASRARGLVWTISNSVTTMKGLKVITDNFPDTPTIVRTCDHVDIGYYEELGCERLVPEKYEVGLQLGASVLSTMGINMNEINTIKDRIRKNNYASILRKIASK